MGDSYYDSTLWLKPLGEDRDFYVRFRVDHVHVELGPEYQVDPKQQDEFWTQTKAICEGHGSRRVLVTGFVPRGERDPKTVIDAGKRTATVPNLWMAFSLLNFKPSPNSELFEVIAAGQGVRVKFFSDTETALKWLRRNAPS